MTPQSAGWKTRSSIPAEAGIGLRFQHHQAVLDTRPEVAWLEVHTENYMGGGTPLRYLDAIHRDYPISLHGIGLSLGSAEGIDLSHLERIRRVIERWTKAVSEGDHDSALGRLSEHPGTLMIGNDPNEWWHGEEARASE